MGVGWGQEAAVIPRPVSATNRPGVFHWKPGMKLVVDARSAAAGRLLAAALGTPAEEGAAKAAAGIRVRVDPALQVPSDEGYVLDVGPKLISILGKGPAGAFYGAQTLLQLMPAGQGSEVRCVRVKDYPRFAWRGMMLDTARHFMPKPAVLKFIDLLAMQKLNVLQLHLTDDQGWRIEIRKYPMLTGTGSMRKETREGHENKRQGFDGKPHGGYYSQADIAEIVKYAQDRFVEIVPEIEMPGHAQAALAAYPELGNTNQKLDVFTQWGVNKNVFNVNEKTILFLQDVLDEVMQMFPGKFIHVGGDEVPLDQWKASPAAQARMKQLGLEEVVELHGYFIRRMDQFITAHGRRLVGWDEILEGGVDKSATVMSWRGSKGGIAAAKDGHDVVMAPTTHTYFDYYQAKDPKEPLAIGGFLPLEKVYSFEPVPAELTPEQGKHILGTQGQAWTEYMPTPSHVEYMLFPRLTALAEVAWTPAARKDYADFRKRLPGMEQRWKALGVNYRPSGN
ncbi:MAG: beta-N-acetylhexosaminidase [Acidobacteria bacterium]|nr:beta-N-acetylhexosaminidase [Acidobacteriota bacterium]